MLGARPDVAQSARDRMLAANPGLQIVGCVSPPVQALDAMDSAALIDDIRAAKPGRAACRVRQSQAGKMDLS